VRVGATRLAPRGVVVAGGVLVGVDIARLGWLGRL